MALLQLLIKLAGGVALLLWGTHMVQTGVQRAFGPNLRSILGGALRNRLLAFCAGLGVTAVLQSSTATGLMISGFAAGGLVDLVPALAVMLGANVGSTLIIQVLSFDISGATPVLILIGVVLFRRNRTTPWRDIGRLFIGLGLMLLALHQLLQAMTPYEDAPSLRILLGLVGTVPLLALLISAAATWLAHSSVAIILIIVPLATKGVVSPDTAFALVLGANLGTAINPVIEGVSGSDLASKRLPIGNLVGRMIGIAIALPTLGIAGRWLVTVEPDIGRAVADYHSLFNAILAIVFLPLLGPYAGVLKRSLPARIDPADPARPLYLDPSAVETPIVALGAAAREALRLIDMLEAMLEGATESLLGGGRRSGADHKKLRHNLGTLSRAIQAYLTTLDPDELSESDDRRLGEVFAFASNLDSAGDVIEKNLLPLAAKRLKRGAALSRADRMQIEATIGRIRTNLRTAAALLMTDDVRGARMLAAEKRIFRDLETAAARDQFERLRAGDQDAAFQLDVLRDLKQINAYLVAGAAYPILEREGGLLDSRITVGSEG